MAVRARYVTLPLTVEAAELWAIKKSLSPAVELSCFYFFVFSDYLSMVNIINSKSSFLSIHGTIVDNVQKDMMELNCLGCFFISRNVNEAAHLVASFAIVDNIVCNWEGKIPQAQLVVIAEMPKFNLLG